MPMGVRVYKIIARDCFVHYAQTERKYNTAHNKWAMCEGRQGILFNPNNFAWPWGTHTRQSQSLLSNDDDQNSGRKPRSLTAPTYE